MHIQTPPTIPIRLNGSGRAEQFQNRAARLSKRNAAMGDSIALAKLSPRLCHRPLRVATRDTPRNGAPRAVPATRAHTGRAKPRLSMALETESRGISGRKDWVSVKIEENTVAVLLVSGKNNAE